MAGADHAVAGGRNPALRGAQTHHRRRHTACPDREPAAPGTRRLYLAGCRPRPAPRREIHLDRDGSGALATIESADRMGRVATCRCQTRTRVVRWPDLRASRIDVPRSARFAAIIRTITVSRGSSKCAALHNAGKGRAAPAAGSRNPDLNNGEGCREGLRLLRS